MAAEIRFEFTTINKEKLEVVANSDGSNVMIFDDMTGDQVDVDDLFDLDKAEVILMVEDWVKYFKDMEQRVFEEHPENDEFGPAYVRGLNKDMGKE